MTNAEDRTAAVAAIVDRKRAWYEVLRGLLVFLIVASMSLALLVIVVRQGTNGKSLTNATETLQSVKETNQRLVDCTTPGHDCYDRSQRNTATLIQKLDEIILLSNYCSTIPGNVGDFAKQRRCVEAGLK